MRESVYLSVRDHCRAVALEWIELMGLGWWSIDLNWQDEYFSLERDDHGSNCAAFVVCDWRYAEATVTFSIAKIANDYFDADGRVLNESAADKVRYLVIHELSHIVVCEMREWGNRDGAIDHEERTVTMLARSWARSYDIIWRRAQDEFRRLEFGG